MWKPSSVRRTADTARKITWGAPQPGDWLTYDGNYSANRYSPLKQITTANVSSLKLKWVFPISYFGLEVTPLAADGVLYVTGPNQVIALDGLTGEELWHYSRPASPGMVGDARLGTNRGVAILRDKVFFMTDNAHLLALSRADGKLVWETPMFPDERQHYGGTEAPLIVDNLVIAGVAGADEGIRGFVAAYKPDNGAVAWRRWTVPLKRRARQRNLARQGTSHRRRFHVAYRLLRPVNRHALLGHRQSLAGRQRQRPSRRQPLHQLCSRAECQDGGDQMALPVHAARRGRSRRDGAQRSGRYGL